ncbi:MAG: hypothetical protein AAFU38_16410, partial [Bacteroidota bacterium]
MRLALLGAEDVSAGLAHDVERSQARAATVVRLMREEGYLSEAEAAFAQANPATLSAAAAARQGGYFTDWVMST